MEVWEGFIFITVALFYSKLFHDSYKYLLDRKLRNIKIVFQIITSTSFCF